MPSVDTDTRQSLHAAAEWLLAGPQYARSGTIRLRVTDAGVATVDGLASLGVDGLTSTAESVARAPWARTLREMASSAGVHPQIPTNLYSDHAALGLDDPLAVPPEQVKYAMDWLRQGNRGLLMFAPREEPVLWPEHFDLAITADEVNFGISLGDDHFGEPYAYVGPWQVREGNFWNAPFGAVRTAAELAGESAIADFFADGARRAAGNGRLRG